MQQWGCQEERTPWIDRAGKWQVGEGTDHYCKFCFDFCCGFLSGGSWYICCSLFAFLWKGDWLINKKGDDKDRVKKAISEFGWDKTRTGNRGERPIVWLYVTKGWVPGFGEDGSSSFRMFWTIRMWNMTSFTALDLIVCFTLSLISAWWVAYMV